MTAKKAAQAIRDQIEAEREKASGEKQIAIVVNTNPLIIQPVGLTYELQRNEFDISQTVRSYRQEAGLEEGDQLLIQKFNGQWVATDVISSKSTSEWISSSPGGPGGSDSYFPFTQVTPASTWVINHGLGKYPSVTIVDSAGTVVIGDVEYIDTNTVHAIFSGGFAGKAYLN